MFSVIFPGQGSQIVGMGKEFYQKFDMFKKLFNEADEILDFPISNLILEGPKDQLDLTENTQPAIFLVGYSIFQTLKKEFKLDFDLPVVLLIQHTVTSEIDKIDKYFLETVNAIKELNVQCLIISGNSDAGSKKISAVIKKSKIQNHSSLPFNKYINLLRNCSVLVGNSSSGIMEAPFLHKPSVNIGARQNGRLKSTSIINVDYNKNRIKRAIRKALENKKTKNSKKQRNLYGDGNSSKKIVKLLEKIDLNKISIQKKLTY